VNSRRNWHRRLWKMPSFKIGKTDYSSYTLFKKQNQNGKESFCPDAG